MSGGCLDYPHWKIENVVEQLEDSIKEGGNRPELRRELIEHLEELSIVLKDLDWSDSGDTGEEDWVDGCRKFLEKNE